MLYVLLPPVIFFNLAASEIDVDHGGRAGARARRLLAGRAARLVGREPRPAACRAPDRRRGLHGAQRQHRLPRLPADGGAARPRPAPDRGPLRRPRHRPLRCCSAPSPSARRSGPGRAKARASACAPSSPATRRSTRRSPACWPPSALAPALLVDALPGAGRRDPADRLLRRRRDAGRERRTRRAADAAAADPPGGVALVARLAVAPGAADAAGGAADRPARRLPPALGDALGLNSMVVAHAYGLDMEITAEAVTWSTAIVVAAALVSLLVLMLHHVCIELQPGRPRARRRVLVDARLRAGRSAEDLADDFTWLERDGTQIHLMHEERPDRPAPRPPRRRLPPTSTPPSPRLREHGFEAEPRRQHWG